VTRAARAARERGGAPFGRAGRGHHGPGGVDYSRVANNPG